MIEIEKCICGGDATWEYANDAHYPRFYVHCTKCGNRTPNAETAEPNTLRIGSYFTRKRAILE